MGSDGRWQCIDEIAKALPGCRRACGGSDGGGGSAIISGAEGRVQIVMARAFEPGNGVEVGDAALHVGMTGLPVVAVIDGALRTGSLANSPVDFTSTIDGTAGVVFGPMAGEQQAHLIGADLTAVVVDDAAAISVAVKAKREIGSGFHGRRGPCRPA